MLARRFPMCLIILQNSVIEKVQHELSFFLECSSSVLNYGYIPAGHSNVTTLLSDVCSCLTNVTVVYIFAYNMDFELFV